MFSKISVLKSVKNNLSEEKRLKEELETADAVVIGAGAGLSTSAGFVYVGERFEKYFHDFAEQYYFTDMYSGGFYPYDTLDGGSPGLCNPRGQNASQNFCAGTGIRKCCFWRQESDTILRPLLNTVSGTWSMNGKTLLMPVLIIERLMPLMRLKRNQSVSMEIWGKF